MSKSVIVVGAGVIGLSSALLIKQTIPEAEVTVLADKFSPHTTSDGSGGFWEPYSLGSTPIEWIRETSGATFLHLKKLAYSPEASKAGASALSGYALNTHANRPPDFFHDIVDGYRVLAPRELEAFPKAKSGFFFTTMQVDVATYLPWLMDKFRALGGKVRRANLSSLNELIGQWDLVVNCCGIGARTLVNDTDIVPIRGQVFRVRAPWIRHFYVLNEGDATKVPEAYILPGTASVVVGGTADVGQWDTTPSDDVGRNIWAAATRLLPQLESAEILKKWAGLRPGRSSVRLEREMLADSGGRIAVIHNYGHGGAGVTLHWGCALKVADMVKVELAGRNGKSKL